MHIKCRYVWQLSDMNPCFGGNISTDLLHLSTQSNWCGTSERGGFGVSYSLAEMNCDKPWIPDLSPQHQNSSFTDCAVHFFMETPMEDLCQESVSRGTQSYECGTVLTPLLRFLGWSPRSSAFCYAQFTPTAVKSMLSCYRVSNMDWVTVRDWGRGGTNRWQSIECNSGLSVLYSQVF